MKSIIVLLALASSSCSFAKPSVEDNSKESILNIYASLPFNVSAESADAHGEEGDKR